MATRHAGRALAIATAFVAVALAAHRASAQAHTGAATAHVDTVYVPDTTDTATTPISPELALFEQRRHKGAGWFLSEAQLQDEQDKPFTDVVTSHFPGVRVMYGERLQTTYLVSTRGAGVGALVANGNVVPCYIQVWVNGNFIVDGDVSFLVTSDLAGVEFYDAARTPAPYRRPSGQCGTLLAWSRVK